MAHPDCRYRRSPVNRAAPQAAIAEATAPAAPAAIPEVDRGNARDYDSTLTYEVGEVVYHRSMNQMVACYFRPEVERTYDRSMKAFLAQFE